MKELQRERKTYITIYQAIDGTEFENKEECRKYEQTAICVIDSHYNEYVKNDLSGEVFPCVGCDDRIEVFDIKDTNALSALNMFLKEHGYTAYTITEEKWTDEEIKKSYYCWFTPTGDFKNDACKKAYNNLIGTMKYKWEYRPFGSEYIGKEVAVFSYDGDIYEVKTKEELIKEYTESIEKVFSYDK